MPLRDLHAIEITGSDTIHEVLDELARQEHPEMQAGRGFEARIAQGVAFATFAYGIDGVSVEIAKYARALEDLFGDELPVHCIGGNFGAKADTVLDPRWKRHLLPNVDGWSKWDHGRWFAKMFYEDMPDGSQVSREVAREIWRQAVLAAERLTRLLEAENVGLLVVVNVNSNPGNFAFAIATVLACELTGCPVIFNNHDFYWEGGRPPEQRGPHEPAGPRDHFFRNRRNHWFFDDFQRVLPWNGRRCIQVNINHLQTEHLVSKCGFDREDVFEVGTALDQSFFEPCPPDMRRDHRRRIAHILSDGSPIVRSVGVNGLLAELGSWLEDQKPLVVGHRDGLELDPASEALWFLQPTRVLARKRIERDWELLGALLRYEAFQDYFASHPAATLTLHVSGPVPIEHRADVERVLQAFQKALASCPSSTDRVFMAFSVGNEDHPSLRDGGLGRLHMPDIYKMSDAVLFPSQTEGRGLPIPESAAAGVPMFCSRYEPEAVFASVIGEALPSDQRCEFDDFPEGPIAEQTVRKLMTAVLEPESLTARAEHNRAVARRRFSRAELSASFAHYLSRLETKCTS